MMKYVNIVALALAAALFSCNDENPASSNQGGNDDDGTYQSSANGTISGSISGGSLAGTVSSGQVWACEGTN